MKLPGVGDIVTFTTARGTVLIGPRAAFGVTHESVLLRDTNRIRSVLQLLAVQEGLGATLKPHLLRWGIDPGLDQFGSRTHLPEWLAQKAERGLIGVGFAPDVTMAFARFAERQEAILAKAATGATYGPDELPEDLQDRFMMVMEMVPDHLQGEVKEEFVTTIQSIGIGVLAAGLLAWIGAHFVPGLNLAVIAFDLFFLSGDVIRAAQTIADTIDEISAAETQKDLEGPAKVIASAIAVLLVAGVLRRFMKAKSPVRSPSKRDTGKIEKPKPQTQDTGQRPTSRGSQRKSGEGQKDFSTESRSQLDNAAAAKPRDGQKEAQASTAKGKGAEEIRLEEADRLLAKASKAEKATTPVLSDMAAKNGMTMEGLDYRLKTRESLARKLEDTPADKIGDSLRYTMVSPQDKLAENTADTLRELEQKGFKVLKVKNTFKQDAPYKGINTQIQGPDGQVFELQFHTPDSFHTKQNVTHGLYEEFRKLDPSDPKAQAMQKKLVELSSVVPDPPDLDKLLQGFVK